MTKISIADKTSIHFFVPHFVFDPAVCQSHWTVSTVIGIVIVQSMFVLKFEAILMRFMGYQSICFNTNFNLYSPNRRYATLARNSQGEKKKIVALFGKHSSFFFACVFSRRFFRYEVRRWLVDWQQVTLQSRKKNKCLIYHFWPHFGYAS